MQLTILMTLDCPHVGILEARLIAALPDPCGITLTRKMITNHEQADAYGLRGSPTLLIDGVDPFAQPGQPTSLSCRIYRDAAGHAHGAPPIDALKAALQEAALGLHPAQM